MRRVLLALVAAFAPGDDVDAQGLGLPAPTNRETRDNMDGTRTGRARDASPGPADDADGPGAPLLRVDFPEREAIPGQFLTLRLTVLVPTFMPEPPVWPGFEAPNLLVRVPEGATHPTSERIDGATWSGIVRRYRIAPMIPAAFEIPSQEIAVTWDDPDADQPARVVLSTGPLAFSGVVPEGAEGLDPFVAASGLTLTQEIAGEPGAMVPGDSVTRSVTATVVGVSPMFLPDLLTPDAFPGLAVYPDEPSLAETDDGDGDGDAPGGTRRESVTYVAESGGGGTLPPVTLAWFDTDSGQIETATVAGVEVSVEGPPAVLATAADRGRLALLAVGGLLLLALVAVVLHQGLPPLRRRILAHRKARQASEAYAWRGLDRVVNRRDQAALHPALDRWAARVKGPDPRRDDTVQGALVGLGQTRYGRPTGSSNGQRDAWRDLGAALRGARQRAELPRNCSALPPLNPGAGA